MKYIYVACDERGTSIAIDENLPIEEIKRELFTMLEAAGNDIIKEVFIPIKERREERLRKKCAK